MDQVCLSLIIDIINSGDTESLTSNTLKVEESISSKDEIVVQRLPALVEKDGELKYFISMNEYYCWLKENEEKIEKEYGQSLEWIGQL